MPKPKTYQYQTNNSLPELAKTYNTTPQAILQANQGAYPFSNGQTINLPNQMPSYQYDPNSRGRNVQGNLTAWRPTTTGGSLTLALSPYFPNISPTNAGRNVQGGGAPGAAPFMTQAMLPIKQNPQAQPGGYGYQGANNQTQQSGAPFYTASAVGGNAALFGMNSPQVMDDMAMRIAQGETVGLTPNQQAAIEKMLTDNASGQGQNGGGGNNDFMNTDFMKKNTASGVQFEDQERWNPQKKRYEKIGDMIRRGTLDNYGRFHYQPTHQQNQARFAKNRKQVAPNPSGFTGSFGLINFGAGSG